MRLRVARQPLLCEGTNGSDHETSSPFCSRKTRSVEAGLAARARAVWPASREPRALRGGSVAGGAIAPSAMSLAPPATLEGLAADMSLRPQPGMRLSP